MLSYRKSLLLLPRRFFIKKASRLTRSLLAFTHCLAPSARPHLSLGPHDVGHEGVPTRCRDFSLPPLYHAKAGFRIGPSNTGVGLEWRFALLLIDRIV